MDAYLFAICCDDLDRCKALQFDVSNVALIRAIRAGAGEELTKWLHEAHPTVPLESVVFELFGNVGWISPPQNPTNVLISDYMHDDAFSAVADAMRTNNTLLIDLRLQDWRCNNMLRLIRTVLTRENALCIRSMAFEHDSAEVLRLVHAAIGIDLMEIGRDAYIRGKSRISAWVNSIETIEFQHDEREYTIRGHLTSMRTAIQSRSVLEVAFIQACWDSRMNRVFELIDKVDIRAHNDLAFLNCSRQVALVLAERVVNYLVVAFRKYVVSQETIGGWFQLRPFVYTNKKKIAPWRDVEPQIEAIKTKLSAKSALY